MQWRKPVSIVFGVLILVPTGTEQIGNAGVLGFPAQEVTQLLAHAEQQAAMSAQYIILADQLRQQILMLRNMVQEGLRWDQVPDLANVFLNDVTKLRDIIQQSRGLSYGFAANDQAFRTIYQPYAVQNAPYSVKYGNWVQITMRTVQAALAAAGIQQDQIMTEPQVRGVFRNMMATAQGRDELLEVTNTISSEMVSQLEKLRLLVASDMQSKQAYTGYQIMKDQSAENAATVMQADVQRGADTTQFGSVPGAQP